jgi:hypothetical protein
LEAFEENLARLDAQMADQRALTAVAVVHADREQAECPICYTILEAQKTVKRTIVTLAHKRIVVSELVTSCPYGCRHPNGRKVTSRSHKLAELLPKGARYGYDIEAFVGIERFHNNAQREEIIKKLSDQHGIDPKFP